jgi:Leucine-rich repeat (LRR) protein
MQVFVNTVLPPGTPALGSLLRLGLVQIGLTELPTEVMKCLTKLQKLDLTDNKLSLLPEALKHLTALEYLDVSDNPDLQFKPRDQKTLAALPRLRALRLGSAVAPGNHRSKKRWTEESAEVMVELARRLTSLTLIATGRRHSTNFNWNMWHHVY